MSWLQWGSLAVLLELGYQRLRRLLVTRGSVDAALSALAGRMGQAEEAVGAVSGRLERVEKELKIR